VLRELFRVALKETLPKGKFAAYLRFKLGSAIVVLSMVVALPQELTVSPRLKKCFAKVVHHHILLATRQEAARRPAELQKPSRHSLKRATFLKYKNDSSQHPSVFYGDDQAWERCSRDGSACCDIDTVRRGLNFYGLSAAIRSIYARRL